MQCRFPVLMLVALALFLLVGLLGNSVLAQIGNNLVLRCATSEVNNLMAKRAVLPKTLKPEIIAIEKGSGKQTYSIALADTADTAIKTIPVVVHVLHGGEAIGTGRNISPAQILSQIKILNEDYSRQANTNGWNTDPRGVDSRFRFVLANRDPSGAPTSGIVRVLARNPNNATSPFSWSFSEGIAMKRYSYWPANDYLNIWVADISDALGYAQYPVCNLPGLANYPGLLDSTDGVAIAYKNFGLSGTAGGRYNLGRSCTHEIGHFLGLLHVWGDVDCGEDYCDDTPTQIDASYYCPIGRNTCPVTTARPGPDMVQNYMNYTDDRCMNIFTHDQMIRMDSVIKGSIRRRSLLDSRGYITGINKLGQNDESVILDGAGFLYSGFRSRSIRATFPHDSGFQPELVVYNYLGCQILKETLQLDDNQGVDLVLPNVPAGVYLYKFNISGKTVVRKIYIPG